MPLVPLPLASNSTSRRRTAGSSRQSGSAGQNLERQHLQRIADQNRGGFIERLVTGRTAAAQVVVVHGRQIVVHQRISVNELHRAGGAVDSGFAQAQRFRGRIDQRGAHALAAAQHAVAQCFVQASRMRGRGRQAARRVRSRHGPASLPAGGRKPESRVRCSRVPISGHVVDRARSRIVADSNGAASNSVRRLRLAGLAQQDLDFLFGLLERASGRRASVARRVRTACSESSSDSSPCSSLSTMASSSASEPSKSGGAVRGVGALLVCVRWSRMIC